LGPIPNPQSPNTDYRACNYLRILFYYYFYYFYFFGLFKFINLFMPIQQKLLALYSLI
jgi:hypothetical protein